VPKYRFDIWEGGANEVTLLDSDRKYAQRTFTCAHCNRVVIVPLRARPDECGGLCMIEFKPVCPECHQIGTCTPFEKRLEAHEARTRLLASLGIA